MTSISIGSFAGGQCKKLIREISLCSSGTAPQEKVVSIMMHARLSIIESS
jgi:hypothetical protein